MWYYVEEGSQSAINITYVSDMKGPTSQPDEAEKTVHFESFFPHHLRLAKGGSFVSTSPDWPACQWNGSYGKVACMS
jgi:hypothetical protein